MAITNWVNEAEAAVTMSLTTLPNGDRSDNISNPVAKSATASDAAVRFNFTTNAANNPIVGPVSIYVAATTDGLFGVEEIDDAAPGNNLVLIGTHTPRFPSAAVPNHSNEFSVSKAFSGRLPNSWIFYVYNSIGEEISGLEVFSIQGHYVTTA